MQNKIIKLAKSALPIIALILILFQYIMANEYAPLGLNISDLDQKIEQVRFQNYLLKEQVAIANSLSTISEKARDLGFSQATYVSVFPEQSVALR